MDGLHQIQATNVTYTSYVVDNVDPPYIGKKRVVLLMILAVARMVIWTTRKKGLYDSANFSLWDLILCFKHQLRVKIKCKRKRLDIITFDKRSVNATSLIVRKGVTSDLSFLHLPAGGSNHAGSWGPHPW